MVKIKFNVTAKCQLELDVENVKDAIRQLSAFAEVFAEPACGACNSPNIRVEHRTDKEGHDYYSLRCNACGCQLSFGQHKNGQTLFTKRGNSTTRGWQHRESERE